MLLQAITSDRSQETSSPRASNELQAAANGVAATATATATAATTQADAHIAAQPLSGTAALDSSGLGPGAASAAASVAGREQATGNQEHQLNAEAPKSAKRKAAEDSSESRGVREPKRSKGKEKEAKVTSSKTAAKSKDVPNKVRDYWLLQI